MIVMATHKDTCFPTLLRPLESVTSNRSQVAPVADWNTQLSSADDVTMAPNRKTDGGTKGVIFMSGFRGTSFKSMS